MKILEQQELENVAGGFWGWKQQSAPVTQIYYPSSYYKYEDQGWFQPEMPSPNRGGSAAAIVGSNGTNFI